MTVTLTVHAVERFQERVRPTLDLEAAKTELDRRADQFGRRVEARPDWLGMEGRNIVAPADAYLLIGDDVVLPLADRSTGPLALSCLVRGSIPPAERRQRNVKRRKRRLERAAHRRGLGQIDRRDAA
jgi:hypothetical protein